MEKNIAIYNEMYIAAERIFNDGINAPAGVYSFAELAKVGTTCKTAPAGVYFREDYNAEHVAPVEGVTEDSDNAEHVAPVEGVTEDSAAEHVEPVEPDNIEPGTTPAAPPLILIL